MSRIKWEFEPISGHWLGKVGARIAFTVKPGADNQSWDIVFEWIGVTYDGFPNLASTRDPAERKLIIFAEQTGLTLPDDVEDEENLAEELVRRLQSEMHWFKDSDPNQKKAEYVATQALSVFEDLVKAQIKIVERNVGVDPEYSGAFSELESLLSLIWDAQEDLGVEVEREGA